MKTIEELPNIVQTLAEKLKNIGVTNDLELVELGSENAIIRIATLENNAASKYVVRSRGCHTRNKMAWFSSR